MGGFSYDPIPPVGTLQPDPGQEVVTIVAIVMTALVLLFSLYQWRRKGSPIYLYAVIASALCVTSESFCLTMIAAWHSDLGQWNFITTFGRPVPYYIALIYPGYYAIPFFIMDAVADAGKLTQGKLWALFGASIALALGAEIVLIAEGFHQYYGPQVLSIAGMPLWWMTTIAAIQVVSALTLITMKRELGGRQLAAAILATPTIQAALVYGLGWPAMNALNSDVPMTIRYAGGVLTIAFCACTVPLAWRLFKRLEASSVATSPAATAAGRTVEAAGGYPDRLASGGAG